jgi:uncharacterized protein YggE
MNEDSTARASWLLPAVIVGGLFFIAGQYVASQPQRAEQEVAAERQITVQGTGKVTAVPDVGIITLGVTTGPQASAEAATQVLSERFSAVFDAVQEFDIAEEDITTTNLTVTPVYDFRDGQQTLRGFEASESVRIKVRDIDQVGGIVTAGTSQGANQVGGISFEIDDPDALQEEAQAAAIADARENAEELAGALDVGLGRVKTFEASFGAPPQPPFFARAALEGVGGDAVSPPVSEGSQDVTATVTITYELR